MNARFIKRCRLMEARPALAFGCLLAITGLRVVAETPAPLNQAPAGASSGDLRFAVAHQHVTSWCYGYLYVSGNQVRYEVVQPQSDRGHSFTADRSNVVVGRRTLWGQPSEALKNYINLKVKGQSYNFLWLANEAEVRSGPARRMTPPEAAPPDTLFSAFQNPAQGAPPVQQGAATQAVPQGRSLAATLPALASGANPTAPQAQPAPVQQAVPAGDVRFAVAHHHKDASWCYGYLYVTHDQVRYEVVQPESDRAHAFSLNRSDVNVRLWVVKANATAAYVQASQNAFELEYKGALHHFRWLANENDVTSGNARPANPPEASPPDVVIRTIQMPTARMPWVMPGQSELEFARNQINDPRPAVWR